MRPNQKISIPSHLQTIIHKLGSNTASPEELETLEKDLIESQIIAEEAIAEFLLKLPAQALSPQLSAFLENLHAKKVGVTRNIYNLTQNPGELKMTAQAYFYSAYLLSKREKTREKKTTTEFYKKAEALGHPAAKAMLLPLEEIGKLYSKLEQSYTLLLAGGDPYDCLRIWGHSRLSKGSCSLKYVVNFILNKAFDSLEGEEERWQFLDRHAQFLNAFSDRQTKTQPKKLECISLLARFLERLHIENVADSKTVSEAISNLFRKAIEIVSPYAKAANAHPNYLVILGELSWFFDKKQGIALIEGAADKNSLRAQKLLAHKYLEGIFPGMQANITKAERIQLARPYLEKAAQQKDVWANRAVIKLIAKNQWPGLPKDASHQDKARLALPFAEVLAEQGDKRDADVLGPYYLFNWRGRDISFRECLDLALPFLEATGSKYLESVKTLNTAENFSHKEEGISNHPDLKKLQARIRQKEEELETLRNEAKSLKWSLWEKSVKNDAEEADVAFLKSVSGEMNLDALGALVMVKQEPEEDSPRNSEGKRPGFFEIPRETNEEDKEAPSKRLKP